MGPFRVILSVIIVSGLLWGPLLLPARAEAPGWVHRTPEATSETFWIVGKATHQTDLTDGRTRAVDNAQDHLMTSIGVHGASVTHQNAEHVVEAFYQFSELSEVALKPAQYYVQRHATQHGTRWDVWVLCAVDRVKLTTLREQWKRDIKPRIELALLEQEAKREAERRADEAAVAARKRFEEANTLKYWYPGQGFKGHYEYRTEGGLKRIQDWHDRRNTIFGSAIGGALLSIMVVGGIYNHKDSGDMPLEGTLISLGLIAASVFAGNVALSLLGPEPVENPPEPLLSGHNSR